MNIVSNAPVPNIFESLISQVQQFGLDPQDWKLVSKDEEQAQLIHRHDETFRFIGEVDFQKGIWMDLQLESI